MALSTPSGDARAIEASKRIGARWLFGASGERRYKPRGKAKPVSQVGAALVDGWIHEHGGALQGIHQSHAERAVSDPQDKLGCRSGPKNDTRPPWGYTVGAGDWSPNAIQAAARKPDWHTKLRGTLRKAFLRHAQP